MLHPSDTPDRFRILSSSSASDFSLHITPDSPGEHLLDTSDCSIIVSDCETDAPEDATLGRNFKVLVDLLGDGYAVVYQEGSYDLVDKATGNTIVSDCETDAPEDATLGRNFLPLVELLNSRDS